ncbi:hypothetical protein LQ318_09195 [Aliifodinibius salicampi]|uniref:Uncharacterized protein n=1 Tax=Fodinibius salicampi TaxID=1920655 RepID=A0ABT3PYX8_9BACT|nr:hypothetical protein [Fodinibius salicampi]MCW9713077.1 hypothetical protein [Fodinibius salicampi]
MDMIKEAQLLDRDQAEQKDIEYWKSKSPEERLSILQELREQYITLFQKEEEYHEARKGLRRVCRIVERS